MNFNIIMDNPVFTAREIGSVDADNVRVLLSETHKIPILNRFCLWRNKMNPLLIGREDETVSFLMEKIKEGFLEFSDCNYVCILNVLEGDFLNGGLDFVFKISNPPGNGLITFGWSVFRCDGGFVIY